MPFGVEKLEWCGYPMADGEKISKISIRFGTIYKRDGRTDTA